MFKNDYQNPLLLCNEKSLYRHKMTLNSLCLKQVSNASSAIICATMMKHRLEKIFHCPTSTVDYDLR